jgi:hypothetical protein
MPGTRPPTIAATTAMRIASAVSGVAGGSESSMKGRTTAASRAPATAATIKARAPSRSPVILEMCGDLGKRGKRISPDSRRPAAFLGHAISPADAGRSKTSRDRFRGTGGCEPRGPSARSMTMLS